MKKIDEYKNVAIGAIFHAGEHIKKSYLNDFSFEKKDSESFVTKIDIETEDIIISHIRKYYPEHSFITEEHGNLNGNRSFSWIIDPIDGTNNFIHRVPYFAICVSLSIDEELVVGFVVNPITEEEYSAFKNEGAYYNGKPIRISNVIKLDEAITGFGLRKKYENKKYDIEKALFDFHKKSQAVRRAGSTALDSCMVARGCYDAYWNYGAHLWDVAASILIVKEAGGTISNFEGKEYLPEERNIIFSNNILHSDVTNIFLDNKISN